MHTFIINEWSSWIRIRLSTISTDVSVELSWYRFKVAQHLQMVEIADYEIKTFHKIQLCLLTKTTLRRIARTQMQNRRNELRRISAVPLTATMSCYAHSPLPCVTCGKRVFSFQFKVPKQGKPSVDKSVVQGTEPSEPTSGAIHVRPSSKREISGCAGTTLQRSKSLEESKDWRNIDTSKVEFFLSSSFQ